MKAEASDYTHREMLSPPQGWKSIPPRGRFVRRTCGVNGAVRIAENTDGVFESADSCFRFGSLNSPYGDCQ